MFPAGAKMPVVVSSEMSKVLQSERRDDAAHGGGHSEQDPRKLRAESSGVPSKHERFVHDLYGKLGREQARGARCPRLSALLSAGPLPPLGIAKVNIGEEKWTTAGPCPGRVVEREPRASVRTHEVGGRLFTVSLRTPSQQLKEALVEFVHQLQTGRPLPLWSRG